jgi:hypothetical protein
LTGVSKDQPFLSRFAAVSCAGSASRALTRAGNCRLFDLRDREADKSIPSPAFRGGNARLDRVIEECWARCDYPPQRAQRLSGRWFARIDSFVKISNRCHPALRPLGGGPLSSLQARKQEAGPPALEGWRVPLRSGTRGHSAHPPVEVPPPGLSLRSKPVLRPKGTVA